MGECSISCDSRLRFDVKLLLKFLSDLRIRFSTFVGDSVVVLSVQHMCRSLTGHFISLSKAVNPRQFDSFSTMAPSSMQ